MGESCINSVTLDEKDYNKYVAICSKTLADQFADTTQKWITCDTETGQMVLVCKYKRAEFTYNIDCTNGLLTFLCKAKYYWLDVVDTTVLVRRAVVITYQEQTIVLVAEQGNLWVVSYDSQEDVVFTKVNTRSVVSHTTLQTQTYTHRVSCILGYKAVSYTHLDVYKRQTMHCSDYVELKAKVLSDSALSSRTTGSHLVY